MRENLEMMYITLAIHWTKLSLMATLIHKGHWSLSSSWVPRRTQTAWILESTNSLCHIVQELCERNYKMLLKDINHSGCWSQCLLFLTLGNSFQMSSDSLVPFSGLAWSSGPRPLPPPSIPQAVLSSISLATMSIHQNGGVGVQGLGIESGQEVNNRGREWTWDFYLLPHIFQHYFSL